MGKRELVQIGYFAKRAAPVPDYLGAVGVTELCSVSECLAKGPPGWLDAWKHNEFYFFNDAVDAWSVVPPGDRREFHLFAYRLLPALFDEGQREPLVLPKLCVQPMDAAFVQLGYDAVSRSSDSLFECSPLSCNHLAETVAVNRYCLLADFDAAADLATFCSTTASRCEPGPYAVVEVWRRAANCA